MKADVFLAGMFATSLVVAGCTSGQARQSARLSNGAEVIQVTPEVKADLRAQGLDPDEEVCKTEEQIGSIIPKRTCATRAMWAAQKRASQRYTSDIQRDALKTSAPGSGS